MILWLVSIEPWIYWDIILIYGYSPHPLFHPHPGSPQGGWKNTNLKKKEKQKAWTFDRVSAAVWKLITHRWKLLDKSDFLGFVPKRSPADVSRKLVSRSHQRGRAARTASYCNCSNVHTAALLRFWIWAVGLFVSRSNQRDWAQLSADSLPPSKLL